MYRLSYKTCPKPISKWAMVWYPIRTMLWGIPGKGFFWGENKPVCRGLGHSWQCSRFSCSIWQSRESMRSTTQIQQQNAANTNTHQTKCTYTTHTHQQKTRLNNIIYIKTITQQTNRLIRHKKHKKTINAPRKQIHLKQIHIKQTYTSNKHIKNMHLKQKHT